MARYIQVNVSTEGGSAVGTQEWSNIGIIGRGVGSGFSVDTAYQIDNAKTAKTLFGESSALYKSILLLFENGASSILAIPAAVTAQTQVVADGDGSKVEFDIGDIPAQPLDSVEVGGVPLVEDTDYIVDYGNGKVTFFEAPVSGTGNVTIDFSKHLAAQITSALTKLEEYVNIQLVLGAMMFESALLSLIKTHTTTMEQIGARQAFYMLKNGETAVTLATTLAGYMSNLIAHKSLKDTAAALCGRVAGSRPWDSLAMRDLRGLEITEPFTRTEQAAFDAAQIIFTHDPPKDNRNAWVVSTPWTLDTTGNLLKIDRVRTLFHLAGVLEYGLTSTNVIGTMRMNLIGLEALSNYVEALLQPWVNVGEINSFTLENPALTLFAKTKPTSQDQAAKAALQLTPRLEGAYALVVGLNYSGAIEYIELSVALVGG